MIKHFKEYYFKELNQLFENRIYSFFIINVWSIGLVIDKAGNLFASKHKQRSLRGNWITIEYINAGLTCAAILFYTKLGYVIERLVNFLQIKVP